MSIKLNDKINNTEVLLAGSSPTDLILNGTSKNPIANKSVYNALKEKIDKTVDDLINYYTKSDVYNKAEVRALINAVDTLTMEVVSSLPVSDISTTTIYLLKPTGSSVYDEYVYVNNAWVKIGTTELDLSNYVTNDSLTLALGDYYTKAEIDTMLVDYATKADVYDKDTVDALLDDKQDVLTFDNVPTSGSNNPVKSGGVYSALEDSVSWDELSEIGAVNLLPNEATTQTVNGVTFTVNSDGSIIANGTATAAVELRIYRNDDGSPNLVGKTITLSGSPDGHSDSTYFIQAYRASTTDGSSGTATDKNGKTTFTWLNNGSGTKCVVSIVIRNGVTVNNIIFNPMLTVPSYNGPYVPYAKTNRELTEKLSNQFVCENPRRTLTITADGTKTFQTLLNDLANRVINLAQNMDASYLEVLGAKFNNSIGYAPVASEYAFLTKNGDSIATSFQKVTAASDSSTTISSATVHKTATSCYLGQMSVRPSGNTYTNFIATVPASGTEISLFYRYWKKV